jgi:hypothetical protein
MIVVTASTTTYNSLGVPYGPTHERFVFRGTGDELKAIAQTYLTKVQAYEDADITDRLGTVVEIEVALDRAVKADFVPPFIQKMDSLLSKRLAHRAVRAKTQDLRKQKTDADTAIE